MIILLVPVGCGARLWIMSGLGKGALKQIGQSRELIDYKLRCTAVSVHSMYPNYKIIYRSLNNLIQKSEYWQGKSRNSRFKILIKKWMQENKIIILQGEGEYFLQYCSQQNEC